jgi:LuxR family maltose regulon positive regulatory protein
MGKTAQATEVLEQGRDEGIRYSGVRSSASANSSLALAEIVYENNELDRARQLIDDSWESALEFGFVDQLQNAVIIRAKLYAASGDMAAVFRVLDEGMAIAIDRRLERLTLALTAERVQQLVTAHALDDAHRSASAAGLSAARPPTRAGVVTSRDELRALTWVRIAMACGRHSDAVAIARWWRTFCESRHAVRSTVRWSLLLAQLHLLSGKTRRARRAMQEALTLGAATHMVRTFVDEGPIVRTLLESKVQIEQEAGLPIDSYVTALLRAFDGESSEPHTTAPDRSDDESAFATLNSRERQILGLVAEGLRNREVAARIGTTEGTVKWHLQRVYDKIGTRRRQHAVVRARKFGLISH